MTHFHLDGFGNLQNCSIWFVENLEENKCIHNVSLVMLERFVHTCKKICLFEVKNLESACNREIQLSNNEIQLHLCKIIIENFTTSILCTLCFNKTQVRKYFLKLGIGVYLYYKLLSVKFYFGTSILLYIYAR